MNHPLIRHLPLESAEDAAVDPSTADLTGRVLHFLGEKAGFSVKHHHIQRAVNWLFENQERNDLGTDDGVFATFMAHGLP